MNCDYSCLFGGVRVLRSSKRSLFLVSRMQKTLQPDGSTRKVSDVKLSNILVSESSNKLIMNTNPGKVLTKQLKRLRTVHMHRVQHIQPSTAATKLTSLCTRLRKDRSTTPSEPSPPRKTLATARASAEESKPENARWRS
jgi:hypothetical protein